MEDCEFHFPAEVASLFHLGLYKTVKLVQFNFHSKLFASFIKMSFFASSVFKAFGFLLELEC